MHEVSADADLGVDVVIATRNRAGFLEQCLAGVRAQTLQPRRVIVVDDGSTDHTRDMLARLAKGWPSLIAISVPHGGVSAARNVGIAESVSEFVAFSDDDDLWLPDMLERQVALFRGRPETGFVYCGFRELDPDGNPLPDGREVRPDRRGDIFRDILERFHGIALSTLVVRRSLLIEIDGFDPSLSQAEDRDICLALARRAEADCTSDVLVGLRKHAAGAYIGALRSNPEFVLTQRLKVWNKWREQLMDRQAVLDRFRGEAARVALTRILMPLPDLGLYRRLKHSDIMLARELFPTLPAYLAAIAATIGLGRRRAAAPPSLVERLKWALARHVVLPNPALLKMARRLGKFVDTPGDAPGDGQ